MNSFIFIAKGTLPEGSIKQDQDKNLRDFSRFLMRCTLQEMKDKQQAFQDTTIFQHPLTEKTLAEILSFQRFHLGIFAEIVPHPDYESPYDNDNTYNPHPIWNAYSLSIDFQYVNVDKDKIENTTFNPRGIGVFLRGKVLDILILTILVRYGNELSTKYFFENIEPTLRNLTESAWNKSL